MINRYEGQPTKSSESGKRVIRSIIYPPIPRDLSDIYLMTTPGDRLDLLAKKYYGDVGYWWMIAEANGVGKGDMVLPPGMQVRIPKNVSKILNDYNELNK